MKNKFLLIEHHENQLTSAKRKLVEDWLSESNNHRDEYQEIIKIWERSKSLGIFENVDAHKEWELILRKSRFTEIPLLKIKRFYKAVALILILLGVSTVIYWHVNNYGYI